MAVTLSARCAQCEAEFQVPLSLATRVDLCSRCQQIEDGVYANDPTPVVDSELWRYSRRAMQERLGVSGEADE